MWHYSRIYDSKQDGSTDIRSTCRLLMEGRKFFFIESSGLVSIFNFTTFVAHSKSTELEFIYAGSQENGKDMLVNKWKNQLIFYKIVECEPEVV